MKRWLMGSVMMVTAVMLCSQSALAGRDDLTSRGTLEAPPVYSDFNRKNGSVGWTGEELLLRDSGGNFWLTYFNADGTAAWPTGNEAWSNMVVNAYTAGTNYSPSPANFNVDGIIDVNGDGQSELALRSSVVNGGKTATRIIFFDDNGTGRISTNRPPNFRYATSWIIEGAGNFNTNTYASFNTKPNAQELLLRNSGGDFWLTYFSENGAPAWPTASYTAAASNVVANLALTYGSSYSTDASNWSVQAIGDFNGDGKDDVVIRTSTVTGQNLAAKSAARVLYFTDNGQVNTNNPAAYRFTYKTLWTIEGAGNFNTNTYSFNSNPNSHELLLRNTDGQFWLTYFRDNGVVAWPDSRYSAAESNVVANLALSTTNYTPNAANLWAVHAIGDVNGDGKDELVLRTSVINGSGAAAKSAARVVFFGDNGQLKDSSRQPARFKYATSWIIQGFNSKK